MNKEIIENIDANPIFSVVILFWNNEKFIQRCLQSLKNQTFTDYEIILINNGSDQPLPTIAEFSLLNIEVHELSENIGFAAGNNFGAKFAKGKYLVTLNADAFPEPNWLENINEATNKYPDYSFASKLVMANDPKKLDGVGDVYHFTGLVWRKYHNYFENSLHLKEKEVFSACAAAAIYPKYAFLEVGGFEPDYFSYVEDIDLVFRLRLAGYRCIFLPDAVVHHVGSGSTGRRSDFSVYYGQRNLFWTFVKNMPGILFWILLPFHILLNVLIIGFSFFRKQGKITIKAKIDAMKDLHNTLSKRRQIQKNRKVTIGSIMRVLDWNPVSPLIKIFKNKIPGNLNN